MGRWKSDRNRSNARRSLYQGKFIWSGGRGNRSGGWLNDRAWAAAMCRESQDLCIKERAVDRDDHRKATRPLATRGPTQTRLSIAFKKSTSPAEKRGVYVVWNRLGHELSFCRRARSRVARVTSTGLARPMTFHLSEICVKGAKSDRDWIRLDSLEASELCA